MKKTILAIAVVTILTGCATKAPECKCEPVAEDSNTTKSIFETSTSFVTDSFKNNEKAYQDFLSDTALQSIKGVFTK